MIVSSRTKEKLAFVQNNSILTDILQGLRRENVESPYPALVRFLVISFLGMTLKHTCHSERKEPVSSEVERKNPITEGPGHSNRMFPKSHSAVPTEAAGRRGIVPLRDQDIRSDKQIPHSWDSSFLRSSE